MFTYLCEICIPSVSLIFFYQFYTNKNTFMMLCVNTIFYLMLYFSEAFSLHHRCKTLFYVWMKNKESHSIKMEICCKKIWIKKMENITCIDSPFHEILLIWSFRKANHIASRGDFMQVFPGLVNCKSKYILWINTYMLHGHT